MVEATGLEPAASWSQTKHSTKLSYASINIRLCCNTTLDIITKHTSFVNIKNAYLILKIKKIIVLINKQIRVCRDESRK